MESSKIQRNDQNLQIYNFDSEIDTIQSHVKEEFSAKNFDLFCKYDQEMVRSSLAKAGRKKALRTILTLGRMIDRDFDKMTREDVDNLVFKIMERFADSKGQETYSSYDNKKHFRIFLRWVLTGTREKREEGDPYEIRGIKLRNVKDRLVREDLITPDDIKKLLVASSGDVMLKAMVHVQYEAGTRPGELLNLRIKHVKIDEYGAKIIVDGKTNVRPIRLVESVPDLVSWLSSHPFKDNSNSPLWIFRTPKNFGKALTYWSARNYIRKITANAGLNKRIFLNLFRHSEATRWATILTEPELKKRQGWSASSKMVARYVHMVDSDVEEKVLGVYGLKKDVKQENIEKPKTCPICTFHNSAEKTICERCGKPLDLKSALKREEDTKEEMRRMMNEILRERVSIYPTHNT